ncbi:MAG: histidinol dehydrogenase [Clostridia bacterium]|nr:histidinol dehydrogenase [Clostridia bacterium]
MIKIYKDAAEALKRGEGDVRRDEKIRDSVAEIIAAVRRDGDRALYEYARLFDGTELSSLEVTGEEIDRAAASCGGDLLRVMERAAENIRDFHSRQVRLPFSFEKGGAVMGQKITPIERVGLYVPGGTAAYPSSVLMNCIPAKIAGCSKIVMVSPPSRGGDIAPAILAAAKIAGVDRVFRVGGAQAVAALAYGTETVPKVDKIVGPGNAYVAEAKRQVFGRVAIDMIAGPSEILVIADELSDPAVVAADLLSQAEHDRMASAILLTDSEKLASAVSAELERQLPLLPRYEIARESIDTRGKIVVCPDIASCVRLSNEMAPEHLELFVDSPFDWLDAVKNAGSIFLGRSCPEALGDYMAGPNHTLPTSGTARFSSPLSVDDFIKKSQFTYFTPDDLDALADDVAAFARAEGLEAHAESVLSRKNGDR